MSKKSLFPQVAILGLLLIFTMGVQGPCDPVPPPFDTTGDYEGEWWSGESELCQVSAQMTMDAAPLFPPIWLPSATFHVDLSCIEVPEWLPPLVPIDIYSVGALDEYGNLIFGAMACGPGFCVTFDSVGIGEDLDQDGMMDEYTGSWAYMILIAGIQPFGVVGEFEMIAVEPE